MHRPFPPSFPLFLLICFLVWFVLTVSMFSPTHPHFSLCLASSSVTVKLCLSLPPASFPSHASPLSASPLCRHRVPWQAAEEAGRNLKVFAVEKNPNAVVTLHVRMRLSSPAIIVCVHARVIVGVVIHWRAIVRVRGSGAAHEESRERDIFCDGPVLCDYNYPHSFSHYLTRCLTILISTCILLTPFSPLPRPPVFLQSLVALEGWSDKVTVISADMRAWEAPEQADILVSEASGNNGWMDGWVGGGRGTRAGVDGVGCGLVGQHGRRTSH